MSLYELDTRWPGWLIRKDDAYWTGRTWGRRDDARVYRLWLLAQVANRRAGGSLIRRAHAMYL